MTGEELKAEIAIEFATLRQVVDELEALRADVLGREPTVREKTAAAAFLAQFYSGIENILKRLSRFHRVELPASENWHPFCSSGFALLVIRHCPCCSMRLSRVNWVPFRRFRHVVHHGYGFQIEWDRMREGVEHSSQVLAAVRNRVEAHLRTV